MARKSRRARLQRNSSDGPHLFSFNLLPRTRRHSFRDCDRAARLHSGRNSRRTRFQTPPPAVAGRRAFANRTSSPANRTSSQTIVLQPDFIHEFVPGTSHRTLLLLHGTGGNEQDLIPRGRERDPNAALRSPRGKIAANGMPRVLRRPAAGEFHLYASGSEREIRIQSFQHPTLSAWSNFFVAQARTLQFASRTRLMA